MTVRVYASTDASAPLLEGVVGGAFSASHWSNGSFIELLNQCLVTGYGSQTAAGWTVEFNGTSKGVFRAGGGTQFYYRVLDDGSLTAGAREASVVGGESASDVDTLVNLFPTAAQVAGGILIRKSNTADATQRTPWFLFADNKTFIFICDPGFSTSYFAGIYVGDYKSLISGDVYNACIMGRVTSATLDLTTNERLPLYNSSSFAAISGHYIARPYTQAVGAINIGKSGSAISNITGLTGFGQGGMIPFPNNGDNLIYMGRLYIVDQATFPVSSVRGYLRGMWNYYNSLGVNPPGNYVFSGTGSLAGRTFKLTDRQCSVAFSRYLIETSDTWD